MFNKISNILYSVSRSSRDLNAASKAVTSKSLVPIIKRVVNKLIGRHIVSKLWWK